MLWSVTLFCLILGGKLYFANNISNILFCIEVRCGELFHRKMTLIEYKAKTTMFMGGRKDAVNH